MQSVSENPKVSTSTNSFALSHSSQNFMGTIIDENSDDVAKVADN
jgi:hypothetical protein